MTAEKYTILFRDASLVVVNKPPELPSQSDTTGDVSLDRLLEDDLDSSIYVVHRLDRRASGTIVYALARPVAGQLSQMLRMHQVERIYWAVVPGPVEPETGALHHRLRVDNRLNKSFVAAAHGKPAVLHYATAARGDRYTLLEVRLQTGRHHQIRAQLAAAGLPIRGDTKYGARRTQPEGGIGLHAALIAFTHPISGDRLRMFASPPDTPLWRALTDGLTPGTAIRQASDG